MALHEDPDRRMVRWGWLIWSAATIAGAFTAWRGSAPEALPQLTIFAAPLILWPAWRGGRWLWHAARGRAYRRWEGATYAFAGERIRIVEDDDGELAIVAADVFDALALQGRARDPQRVRVLAGTDGLVHVPAAGALCFSVRGLEAWLVGRADPKAGALRHWLDVQVVAPHRRRRFG